MNRLHYKFFIHLLPLLLLLGLFKTGYTQGFHNLSVENGLSNATTFAIAQDEKGLMWFSTKEGIDRYDGSGYKHYDLYPAAQITRYGLRRNKFHVDARKRIWVNNFSDIFIYEPQQDKFKFVYQVSHQNTVRDLFVDAKSGTIYLATDQGLIKYNYHTKKTFTYPNIRKILIGLALYDEQFLLLAAKKDVQFFDLQSGKLAPGKIHPAINAAISKLNLSAVAVDHHQHIITGSTGQISMFHSGDSILQTNENLNARISKVEITKILPDNQEAIYFGTEGKGAYKISTALQILQPYLTDNNDASSLPENEAVDIFIDNENRVWFAGHEISYLNANKLKFKTYTHQINKTNSLVHNSIRSVVEDRKGNLWIGTNYGISILKSDRQHWDYINTQQTADRSTSNKITALTRGAGDDVIVGTYQNGIYRILGQEISHISPEKEVTFRNNVNTLLLDGDQLWSGGAGVFLKMQQLKTGAIQTLPISNVLSLAKNSANQLIAGGHNGLHIINPDGKIQTYNASTYKIGSIFSVSVALNGDIWLGAEGQGLIRFSKGRFKKYSTRDGLPSNLIYGVLNDNSGNLWLSTTKGLSCFNIAKETFRNYGLADGLGIKEFAYGAYARTASGEMVFGGNHGFILFNPAEIVSTKFKTRLIFTDFKIFNRSADIDVKNSPLRAAIDETRTIELKYNQNAVTFDFTSVNYTNEANLYRWKLDGLEKDWSPATSEHTANYTNLKPGKYTYRVQWTNSGIGSQFSANERTIYMVISPPFWATPWAYLLYTLIAGSVIYSVIKFYHIQLSELHAKDKIRFFINIVHDIRTPLSLIKSPLSIALKKNDFSAETQEILKTASHNTSRLNGLIDQLLDFEKADFKKLKLKISTIQMEKTLDQICNDFIPLLEQRGIILTRNYKDSSSILRVDKDKFDKIIFNILSNAVKYTPKGGQIDISTNIFNKYYHIAIRDSGLGIPKEQHKMIFKRFFRAKNVINSNEVGFGIGLMVTKELVKMHQGDIWFDSHLNHGTTFHLKFPLPAFQFAAAEAEPSAHFDEMTEPMENASSTTAVTASHKKAKILIAEDNEELRTLMSRHLSGLYHVQQAVNGQEGLLATARFSPDVIISDMMMPVMDGNEFCYEIKNNIKTSHIPFILLTALSTNEHKIESYRTGADTYLEKPFDLDLLISCINNLLENRKKLREKFAGNELPVGVDLSPLDKKFIEQAIKITEENLANPDFAIEDLEKQIGMSHASLYRKFKGLLGKTPLEFIQQYRLKQSMELLVSGKYNVNEVAYLVGFSDPKYFSTVFKKYFGQNASQYLRDKSKPAD
ncbi:hybrid sensor histidine kinase/response regulator transcription factor [Pedobacter sp. MR2016-24]|uniref:hybrid sensor histidine kinase/response regulator transcription factor n=1 Tax=Pedobacter sp. MR2016-24 TaxID=2994466 RepID=UPI002247AE20|nr:hybrid sensor histidine kinase/response regulator transcription factor [Pedobacter sp. MR2016-24]MCX2486213.1 ATP-binding protein [Pedobacter sp. MR2016-24]